MSNSKVEKKDIQAYQKSIITGKWAETMFKAIGKRMANRWRFVSFRSQKGHEWRGVVDLLVIRKDTSEPSHRILKRGDLFEIMIIQIKGGSAPRPTPSDIQRLKLVKAFYKAKDIVLYEWKKGKTSEFSLLGKRGQWESIKPVDLFK